ncbi:MAG: tRNA (adenosine(37)-N6)-threonylcarbamoyltransferase complex transferase subunit TsaD [Burkholderiales bacterium]|nr:tRNA (adenosine(37)-N6)-threonylcarbamoyltransferase complex transferase subunit TsaD [Burkholderiales bacterium]
MKILSIETSCDDTAITIFEAKGAIKNARLGRARQASFKILANTSNSQINIHAQYGGVFPMLAKREHIKNLPILLQDALEKSRLDKKKKPIDLIAVTYGPGLEPSLWTGIVFAKELSEKYKIPIIPVNHMEGHIMSVFGKSEGSFKIPKVNFPVLSLLVSGGHTELILSKDWLNYKIIGETLDDAAGEAYDKVARMMGLTYPGGPQISKLAEEERKENEGKEKEKSIPAGSLSPRARGALPLGSSACETPRKNYFSFSLPRPMIYSKNFDFSFSGLKTAVLYLIRDLKKENQNILQNEKVKQAIALEFENAVVETLTHKTKKAIEKYKPKTLIVAGGVSCNEHLQREIKKSINKDVALLFPEKKLTGDNSIMIGIAGYLQYIKKNNLPADRHGKTPKTSSIKAKGNLRLK